MNLFFYKATLQMHLRFDLTIPISYFENYRWIEILFMAIFLIKIGFEINDKEKYK